MQLLLIVRTGGDENLAGGPALVLNGQRWTVRPASTLQQTADIVDDYICVSYIWGSERERNTASVGPQEISTNTIPALTTAMQNTNINAFWIDAFCIPTTRPARAATLESLGYIYSQAREVRAVLSRPSFQTVTQLSLGDRLDEDALNALEQDQWVQSVWTYQEVVNCRSLGIMSPGAHGAVVDGSGFLNGLGYTISKYKEHHQISSFRFRRLFPALDALEDLIADWMIAGPEERSALAVMSSMDRRIWSEDKNYFYTMIGAITTRPRLRSQVRPQHLAETFTQVCEEKGDFSYIYSSAARSGDSNQAWRPRHGLLPSILPWHSWGGSQPGQLDDSGRLRLDRVLTYQTARLSDEAGAHIALFLHQPDLVRQGETDIKDATFEALLGMGFSGSKAAVPLHDGFFFPQVPLPVETLASVDVIVSGVLRWTIGAPGLARYRHSAEGPPSFTPGVFAGIVEPSRSASTMLV